MDDFQSPGDIAYACALNDGQLLFTPLSNYLYRFVSVHLSAFWTCVSSSLWQNTQQRKNLTVSPAYWCWGFFWRANKYNCPRGIPVLFEVIVKIEGGRMQLPEYTISFQGHNCFTLWTYVTVSWIWCALWNKSPLTFGCLWRVWTSIITHIWALLWLILEWPELEEVKENDNSYLKHQCHY